VAILITIITLVLIVAVIFVISAPLRAAWATSTEPVEEDEGAPDRDRPRADNAKSGEIELEDVRIELEASREAKYREIRDTELDYRTGKLSQEDFAATDDALRAEAVEILDRLAALDAIPKPEVES
jgi:hypothetical protein